MTPQTFAHLAQTLGPNVVVRTILDSTRFQVGGKTFATVGWPEQGWAVVKVDPTVQRWALSLSDGLAPELGRRRGAGIVLARLAAIDDAVAAELLAAAWRYAVRPSERGRRERSAVVASVDRARTAA